MSLDRPPIRTVNVTRYVTPLREGSSLPAIIEADDDGLYVLKFRGAGQGVKALIAELVAGEIARQLGLRVPEIVFANLDVALSRLEPDLEIQELLRASAGLNLALDYLPGSIAFNPLVADTPARLSTVDAGLASRIVWFDCFVTNVDRTPRNTNLLIWHKNLWLIDHGASLYFHHAWQNWEEHSRRPFTQVKDHLLLSLANDLEAAESLCRSLLLPEHVNAIVSLIPDSWLINGNDPVDSRRQVYNSFLLGRLAASGIFTEEALRARQRSL